MFTKKLGKRARQSPNSLQADASFSTPRVPVINQRVETQYPMGLVFQIIASATPYAIERARSRAAQRKRNWTATASVVPAPRAILKLQIPLEIVTLQNPTFPQSTLPSAFQALVINGLQLPEVLKEPCRKTINIEMPAAINKNLASLPLGYVKYELEREGYALLDNLKRAKILLPEGCSHIGEQLEVAIDRLGPDLPTHILAIVSANSHTTSPHSTTTENSVWIHLTHDIILATHCASLPASSLVPKPTVTPSTPRKLKLPVIALALPHPPSFPFLHLYLYTKCAEELLTNLLPVPPAMIGLTPNSQGLTTVDISRYLFQNSEFQALYKLAVFVRGVWANACQLGIWESDLWRVVGFSWEVAYEALRLAIRRQRDS